MNRNEVLFTINPQEQILFTIYNPLQEVDCCYIDRIFFVQSSEESTIAYDNVRHALQKLRTLLTDALQNKLPLDPSINNNIGYLYAQYSFNNFNKTTAEALGLVFDEHNNWVGRKHLVWADQMAVWMYNNANGSIILEFTPWYTDARYNEEYESDYPYYQRFLQEYKPICIRILSQDAAQQWLHQTNDILKQIDTNIKRKQNENCF